MLVFVRLRGQIYPLMVRDFYVQMLSMFQNASCHTVTVHDVTFKVSLNMIAQLLEMFHASKPSTTTQSTEVEQVPDISTYALAIIGLVDSHVYGDHSRGGNDSEDLQQDKYFFILTRKTMHKVHDEEDIHLERFPSFFLYVAFYYCNKSRSHGI